MDEKRHVAENVDQVSDKASKAWLRFGSLGFVYTWACIYVNQES
jgi:hypothetical protein